MHTDRMKEESSTKTRDTNYTDYKQQCAAILQTIHSDVFSGQKNIYNYKMGHHLLGRKNGSGCEPSC